MNETKFLEWSFRTLPATIVAVILCPVIGLFGLGVAGFVVLACNSLLDDFNND